MEKNCNSSLKSQLVHYYVMCIVFQNIKGCDVKISSSNSDLFERKSYVQFLQSDFATQRVKWKSDRGLC